MTRRFTESDRKFLEVDGAQVCGEIVRETWMLVSIETSGHPDTLRQQSIAFIPNNITKRLGKGGPQA